MLKREVYTPRNFYPSFLSQIPQNVFIALPGRLYKQFTARLGRTCVSPVRIPNKNFNRINVEKEAWEERDREKER